MHAATPHDVPALGQPRILVADDDPEIATMLSRYAGSGRRQADSISGSFPTVRSPGDRRAARGANTEKPATTGNVVASP
jgi:CheY-like chemotaxis protein